VIGPDFVMVYVPKTLRSNTTEQS